MKNKLLILFGMILLIPLVSAELQINPTSLQFNGNISQDITLPINFSNTFSFPIYNLSFSSINYVTFPIIEEIQQNENISSSITINTGNNEVSSSQPSTISFIYLTDDIATPKTYQVNITASGFQPFNLNLKIQDKINFTNKQIDNASLTQLTPSYNPLANLQQDQSYLYTISSINSYTFHDADHPIPGLSVTAETNQIKVPTSNPSYNKQLTIGINTLGNSSIIYSFNNNNLTIENGKSDETILNLENIGNTVINNINLYCDWCSFSSNDFDLDLAEDKNLILTVEPEVNKTSETNKTHTIQIHLTSDNTQIDIPLYIFIPYKEILEPSNIQGKIDSLREELLSLIEELNDLGFNASQIIFQPVPHSVNYTDEEIKDKEISREMLQRMQNDVNELRLTLGNLTSENQRLGEELEESNERKNKESIGKSIFWFFATSTLLVIIVFILYKYIKKIKGENQEPL